MEYVVETRSLSKSFNTHLALDQIDLAIEGPSIIGLLGRNGSGKTTLFRHLVGLYLPTGGTATTLGKASDQLAHEELGRIGFVPQEIRLLDWMSVEQHLHYVASFYRQWDKERQQRLLAELELDPASMVGALSTGNLQKLAIIMAVCHHPDLLILDEPVSDLDPIVRGRLLEFLLEILRDDQATIMVSSHVLRDVEKIVDRVICLEQGKVTTNAALDDLKDQYAEWLVNSRSEELPTGFEESFILEQEIDGSAARLIVMRQEADLLAFEKAHQVEISSKPLNLEDMFPFLVREGRQ